MADITIDDALAKALEFANKAAKLADHYSPENREQARTFAEVSKAFSAIASAKATQELETATYRAANGARSY
jgi:hypothetical protein